MISDDSVSEKVSVEVIIRCNIYWCKCFRVKGSLVLLMNVVSIRSFYILKPFQSKSGIRKRKLIITMFLFHFRDWKRIWSVSTVSSQKTSLENVRCRANTRSCSSVFASSTPFWSSEESSYSLDGMCFTDSTILTLRFVVKFWDLHLSYAWFRVASWSLFDRFFPKVAFLDYQGLSAELSAQNGHNNVISGNIIDSFVTQYILKAYVYLRYSVQHFVPSTIYGY